MTYALVQSVEGTRVTSGTTITTTYTTANVTAGNLLVAIVGRTCSTDRVPTVGQVTDNQGNYWKQAVECTSATTIVTGLVGIDIWYCESAGGGNKPAVTATLLGFPANAITGMNMQVLEYSGSSGHELVDQIGQVVSTTTTATVTTNFNLANNHDLAISVFAGNGSAATVPSGYTSRLADTTQKFWVADNVDTGTSSGATFSAPWTALTGNTTGTAILVCFSETGVSTPTLLQSSYIDQAFPQAPATVWTSQPYPVNPTAGNTLVAFVAGIYAPHNTCESLKVTDTANNTWTKLGTSGRDDVTGVNWAVWICRSARAAATTLSVTFSPASQGFACLLLEFTGYSNVVSVDQIASVTDGNTNTVTTSGPVQAGDLAIAIISALALQVNAPAAGWSQVLSDTSGVGYAQYQLATTAGTLTASWSMASPNGCDILLATIRSGGNTHCLNQGQPQGSTALEPTNQTPGTVYTLTPAGGIGHGNIRGIVALLHGLVSTTPPSPYPIANIGGANPAVLLTFANALVADGWIVAQPLYPEDTTGTNNPTSAVDTDLSTDAGLGARYLQTTLNWIDHFVLFVKATYPAGFPIVPFGISWGGWHVSQWAANRQSTIIAYGMHVPVTILSNLNPPLLTGGPTTGADSTATQLNVVSIPGVVGYGTNDATVGWQNPGGGLPTSNTDAMITNAVAASQPVTRNATTDTHEFITADSTFYAGTYFVNTIDPLAPKAF